jgi:acyl carrier protein
MSYEIELSTGIKSTGIKRSADILDLIEMVLWLEEKYKINIDDFDIEEMQKMMKIKE